MNFIYSVFSLSAISNLLDFVQADYQQDLNEDARWPDCNLKSKLCVNQMVTKVTAEDIMGLCDAKPLTTTSTKCLMDCQMRELGWLSEDEYKPDEYLEYIKKTELDEDGSGEVNFLFQMSENGFQIDKYLEYIRQTELGQDETYVQAAEQAADVCKDKKAPVNDKCETAYLILKCLQDEGDKLQKINLGYGIFYVEPFFLEF